ncbi:ATP-binding protein [Bacteroidota bacterium]
MEKNLNLSQKEKLIEELNWLTKEAVRLQKRDLSKETKKEFESRFRTIMRGNLGVKLLVKPGTGNIVDANDFACKFYGYTIGELKKKKITEINKLSEEEVIEEYKRQKIEKRDFFINKQKVSNGEIKYVEIRSASIILDGIKHFYFLIHEAEKSNYEDDIDKDKINGEFFDSKKMMIAEGLELIERNARDLILLTSKLAESEKKLLELNANKDRFFSIVSHDIKNHFASILGLSRLLTQSGYDKEPDKRKLTAEKLHDSAKKLFALLENLLEWAKLQRKEIGFQPVQFNIYKLLSEVLELFSIKLSDKGIKLKNKLPEDIEGFADPDMIRTVLRNLLSNAINFTKKDGIITINFEKTGKEIVIKVLDTGVGIKQENLTKLFRIEEKYIGINTEGEKGTGLGLILCKEFIEKNKGRIWALSSPGKGSTFMFTIPPNKQIA